MDIHRQPHFPDEPVSQFQSHGSNCRSCSQPRKISRGIPIDSPAKYRSKNINKKEAVIPTEEYVTPKKVKSAENRNRVEAANATNSGKQGQALENETSPWLSTRSVPQKIPATKTAHGAETTQVLLPTTETHGTCVAKETLEKYSVQCFDHQKPGLKCNETPQRQSDGVIYVRKDHAADDVEKLSHATIREVMVEDKTKKEKTRGSETLRLKLWEILGTVSSPNKEQHNEFDLKVETKDAESLHKNNAECAFTSKQNSDTIESDSEYPSPIVGRPMTRSSNQRKTSNKLKENMIKKAPGTYYKKGTEGKNTSSIEEGFATKLSYAISGGSLMLKRKNSEIRGSAIEAHEACSPEQGNHGEKPEVLIQKEIVPPSAKSKSYGSEGGDSKGLHCRRKRKFIEPKNLVLEKDSLQFPVIKMSENLRNVIDSSKLQKNVEWEEDVNYSFLQKKVEELNAQSPSFEMKTDKTPGKRSSPGFPPTGMKTATECSSLDLPRKPEPELQGHHNPKEMAFPTMGIQCFKGFLTSKSIGYQSHSPLNSFGDAGELDDTPTMNSRPAVEEEPKNTMSKSSSDNSHSETPGEGLRIKGIEHNSKFPPHLELNQKDGLPRAIASFALALERVKSKMKSVAQKRSDDILVSIAERIHLQLQNAESQIQADLGKLTNRSKSKRKCLEMRCQELQGELHAIHERFKEDIKQHIQGCRIIVEGLEAQQMELKVTMEKQRTSHRKLLLQAEEAIQTELGEAQRGITAIQNSARVKMLQLKNILADCLKEGHDGEIRAESLQNG